MKNVFIISLIFLVLLNPVIAQAQVSLVCSSSGCNIDNSVLKSTERTAEEEQLKRGLEIALVVLVIILIILGLVIGFNKLQDLDGTLIAKHKIRWWK